jgi:tetratricopeptide (TPR) repeat protein
LSDLYLLVGDRDKARDTLTPALELARAAADPVGEAAILTRMGRLMAANGDWQQAIDLSQRSLALSRSVNNLQGERTALVDLAQTERERKNLSQARIIRKHWS